MHTTPKAMCETKLSLVYLGGQPDDGNRYPQGGRGWHLNASKRKDHECWFFWQAKVNKQKNMLDWWICSLWPFWNKKSKI